MKRIAITKSKHTLKEVREILNFNNIKVELSEKKLYYIDKELNLQIILVRSKDVVSLVEKNIVDYGIVGEDILIENKNENYLKNREVGISVYHHCICGLNNIDNFEIGDLNNKKIYTQYPKITEYFLKKNKINSSVSYIQGSAEAYLHLMQNSFIEDIVNTGESLRKNNAKILMKIFSSKLNLIFKKDDSFTKKFKSLNELKIKKKELNIEKLKKYLSYLDNLLDSRKKNNTQNSYTSNLLNKKSRKKIVQKIVEEIIEVSLEIYKENSLRSIVSESADVLFHFLLLLKYENIDLNDVIVELDSRRK